MPPYIKKLSIRQFVNNTTAYGLEDKLTVDVVDEFIRDGRFTITNPENSEGELAGEITYYILQPLTYGPNLEPQQYKLRVLLNIYFIDKINNFTLWQETNLEGIHIFTTSTLSGGITEDEAREYVWRDLSQKIIMRTIQGFGTVSGISEKKLPPMQKP